VVVCGRADSSGAVGGRDTAPDAPATTLEAEVRVSAAASLTDAFGEVAAAFEALHAGTDVVLNLGGSSALRAQILEGAPVDVFVSANASNMEQIVAAGAVAGEPVVFARNRLQIAVPAGNPGRVSGLEDFARGELLVGLCAEQLPCGELAREALARAGVAPAVDTNEPDVRALLTKVELGELDAAITYTTDVASARGRVAGIDVPAAVNVEAAYPIAVLADAPHPRAAALFVAFVTSAAGRAILARHGFAGG
jgi:molybdate transport system substrate-binding protein